MFINAFVYSLQSIHTHTHLQVLSNLTRLVHCLLVHAAQRTSVSPRSTKY